MSTDLDQNTSPTKQAEIEGWMVLVSSPTHDSNESQSSEGENTVTKKRKVRRPAPSSRVAKSPRVSPSQLSVESTRPQPFGTQERYSSGMTSASQPTVTRTWVSCNGGEVVTTPNSSIPRGNTSNSFLPSAVTRPSDHFSGVSRVPRSIQRSSISASQPNPTGSHLKSNKQSHDMTSFNTRKTYIPSTSASYNEGPGLGATRRATANHFRGSSSDELPDPAAILRSLSSHTSKSKGKEVKKSHGKEIARRKIHCASSVASDTGLNTFNARDFSSNSAPANKSMVVDDDVIIISSDSEVEAQLTVKKSRPCFSQPSSETNLKGSRKAKQHGTKAFLADSDDAIELASDPDTSTSTAAERIEERMCGLAAGPLPRAKGPGSISRSSITPSAREPVPLHPKQSDVASQTTNPMPLVTAKRAIAPLPVNGYSSDRRRTSKRVEAPIGSPDGTRKALAKAEPSLADVISMSLGGNPSIRPEERKRARSCDRIPRPTQQTSPPRPSSNFVHSNQKLASPPVDVEIIDLCSDSDDLMNVDDPASEAGPSGSIQGVGWNSAGSQPAETIQKGKILGHLPSVFSAPRESTPPTIPTSSLPTTSPSRLSLFLPCSEEDHDNATLGNGSHNAGPEYTSFPNTTSLLHGDAFEDNSVVSSVHGPSPRSSTRSLIVGVASRSSNEESYRTSPPSSLVGSKLFRHRNRSAESEVQNFVPSISEVHLHTPMDSTQQENVTWPGEGDVTSHETLSEGTLAVNSGTRSSASERASSATSSGMDLSIAMQMQNDSSRQSLRRSIQRARKTTRKDTKQLCLNNAQTNRNSRTSGTKSIETHKDAAVTTPSTGRVLVVKEPDFSKLRAEVPSTLSTGDNLSVEIKWPAEKVPIELHEMINRLPLNYHYNAQMKHVFEAMMEENTADDEPTSPRIGICGRKGGPITPPWEFYYTNKIFHGEGVPRSNKKALKGCNCIGPCNPKSKTCACVKRQMAWTAYDKSVKGFLYNQKGKLLDPSYPVFECNDACECSDSCVNRVIQHGRQHAISIVLTQNKGWGVFADEKIPRGTYLGIYAGEMILESEADERGRMYDKFGRTYLFDMDFYYLRKLDEDKQKRSGDTHSSQEAERFSSTYTIDAFHVGNFTRFLNHSCDPNCQITASYVNEPDLRKPILTIYTCREVRQGEELTFAYFGNDVEEKQEDAEIDEHGQQKVKVPGGPSTHQIQAVYRPCLCGAANCRGAMF